MDWFFTEYPEDVQKEFNHMIKLALNSYGYDVETLDKIKSPDVDMEYIKEILK